MLFRIFSLTCLVLLIFFIQSTICSASNNIQNLELEDVTSLWDQFPSFIDKIKEAVSRFRCPKGWKRLGGSCYYYSNLTSTSTHVNHTCNYIHSNYSNLIQIQNAVELFYAAHVLSRNNLTSLMIEIHPNLLKGKKITDMLMNDEGRWERMKKLFPEVRAKYQRLKKEIIDRLNSIGLRVLRRSKKIKPIPPKQDDIHDEIYYDESNEYEYDDKELHITNVTFLSNTTVNISSIINNDEYEYDDLDSSDETDEFEQIENIRGICDDIHWNVLNNNTKNTTVYILTKYIMSDKIICSLSNIEPQRKYHYICEYVIDFCFANILCGKHGNCVNTLQGFKCACSFLHGGVFCERISENGYQIIGGVIMIIILAGLSVKPIRYSLWFIVNILIKSCKKLRKSRKKKKVDINDDTQQLVIEDRLVNVDGFSSGFYPQQRRPTIAQEFVKFIRHICRCITLQRNSNPLLSPVKRNLVRNIWVGILSVMFLTLLFAITTIMYFISFGYNLTTDDEHFSLNNTIRLVTDCARISDYRRGNLTFAPCACALILLFSWSIKRENLCLNMCDGRPGLIPPIEPFHTGNRYTTATVFGILAFEVLKIFEELLFSTGQPLEHGVLVELLQRIAIVIVVGLRYYPVLASLQLRNLVVRFFACLYIICNIIYTIVREGSCMGFLPLSGQYTAVEEAKLRRELGTWFIVYGLIKNIPHFFFLSYIGAELCVRFAYDSIYVPRKKHQSIWTTPIVQLDESEFAKYYVTKLFRRNHIRTHIITKEKIDPDKLIDYEHEIEQQDKDNQSYFQKFINHFCQFDDHFRFTTMAMCTYTVAVVFLYYLACTFVFLYVSRTTGHVAFLKFYFKSTFDVDLGAFSFKTEIILSAIFTAILFGSQLVLGMKNYKKHKLQLYQGICADIPLATNFKPSSIASNSVHYSGFLVGYMAWGFVICFHLVLIILIGIRVLSLQIRHVEIVLSIVVPILVIYLLKMLSMTSAGKFLFIQRLDDKLNLKSRKTFAVFLYFSFFADCFLGMASCIIRLIKATCLNVVFMARLDWSFLGRPLEKFDIGFAAYVSYLHMEVTYTHPVMLAFCYSLYDDIVQRRPKHCYADECCIAPGELDDENDIEIPRQNQVEQTRKHLLQKLSRENNDELSEDNIDHNENETVSKRKSFLQELPMTKITSKIESQNLSIITTSEKTKNTKKKTKPSQSNITNEENVSDTSTTITQQQLTFILGPKVPTREDHPSGQDESDDDDDGDLELESISTIEKLIPKPKPRLKSLAQASKINTDNQTEDKNDDEDKHDDISKRKEFIKKKNLKKRKKDILKSNIPQEEDDDSHTAKTHDTIKMIIPSKQPILDSRKAKEELSSADNPDDGVRESSKYATQETTFYSSLPSNIPTKSLESHFLRTISYLTAQQNTPPCIPHRSHLSSIASNQTNINDGNSHYSEITTDTNRSGVSNRSYSKVRATDAPSHHSNKQEILEEQKQNNDINMETEEQQEDDDDEDEQEGVSLLKTQPTLPPNEPKTACPTDPSNNSEEVDEKKRIKRRKQLRFRWHFLYTMLRNYHLFDLTKDVQSRLTRLRLQRSTLIDEQQLTPMTMEEVPTTMRRAAASVPMTTERGFARSESEIPATFTQRPPPPQRLISVPVSVSNDYPSSPAERYIAIRAQMLYDANTQESTTPYSPSISRAPTTVSAYKKQFGAPLTAITSDQSLGFHVSPDIIVQPPSERSIKSADKQETTSATPRILPRGNITPSMFQPISASNQSTADYPLADSSIANLSTYRTQMSHDQHMQAWRQNKVEKIQKKQKHTYVYGISPQPTIVDRVSTAAILTPQNITTTKQRQAPPTAYTTDIQRGPTPSPFRFPLPSSQIRSTSSSVISDTQLKPKKQKSKTNLPPQEIPAPPPRMDRVDEDPQEISTTNKSSEVTSALIHRQDSQISITDAKED